MALFTRLFLVLGLFVGLTSLRAEDLGTIQKRMQARQTAIDSLKTREAVGENNQGFLEVRGTLKADESTLVSGENADRGVVYAELAKRNGSTADTVGRVRAKRIAELSTAGIWLQDEGGRWYKK